MRRGKLRSRKAYELKSLPQELRKGYPTWGCSLRRVVTV